MKLSVPDLQRFYMDLAGLRSLSIQEYEELKSKASKIKVDLDTFYYETREESINSFYERFAKWHETRRELGLLHIKNGMGNPKNRVFDLYGYALDNGPTSLHYYAFLPAIELLGSDEQQAEWVPKTNNVEILGAYVQTEMGHGSDVSQLMTTATYDEKTKEYVIHTPCLEATKFWPGGLGKTASHCVLYARLISQGKDHGVQAFIMQLRDTHTHLPLPGINIGDVGSKLGFRFSDQGFCQFTHHRIPKTALLDRFV